MCGGGSETYEKVLRPSSCLIPFPPSRGWSWPAAREQSAVEGRLWISHGRANGQHGACWPWHSTTLGRSSGHMEKGPQAGVLADGLCRSLGTRVRRGGLGGDFSLSYWPHPHGSRWEGPASLSNSTPGTARDDDDKSLLSHHKVTQQLLTTHMHKHASSHTYTHVPLTHRRTHRQAHTHTHSLSLSRAHRDSTIWGWEGY